MFLPVVVLGAMPWMVTTVLARPSGTIWDRARVHPIRAHPIRAPIR
jgi:hypothetical protein